MLNRDFAKEQLISNTFKILIIIPAYNEEKNIEKVVNNIISNFPQYEYIIINDCSIDNTETICIKNGYNYISLPVNLGIGGGVQCGYLYAHINDYDVAIQVDGDGQHDPEYIQDLLDPIVQNRLDMVIGSRFIKKQGFQTSFMRRVGISAIKLVILLCSGIKITDTTSGFRAVNKELIRFFAKNYAQDYPEPEAIVSASLNGFRVGEVPVLMHERVGGVSSINALRSIYYMIKVSLSLIIYRLSIRKKREKEI